jgi:uncharacterized YceG family protein
MAKRKVRSKQPSRKKASRKSFQKKFLIAAIFLVVLTGSVALYYTKIKPLGLSLWESYQNIASPNIRTVKIDAGMRKEEVVARFAKTLGWTLAEQKQFITLHTKANNNRSEGYYLPGTYIVSAKAKPAEVSKIISDRFKEKVLAPLTAGGKTNVINIDTAIKIASIIQREAAGKSDARIVSGIIWNRIFQGMSLDMDATLQYAKGTDKKWWPKVVSEDKYIISPFNTYKNKGLPPTAISNPSVDAIQAALNPIKTTSIFYIHDDYGNIHTARTYQEHVANIKRYY